MRQIAELKRTILSRSLMIGERLFVLLRSQNVFDREQFILTKVLQTIGLWESPENPRTLEDVSIS